MEREIADILQRPPYEWCDEKRRGKIAQAACAVANDLNGLNKGEIKIVFEVIERLTYEHLLFSSTLTKE